ncbi:MAG: DUF3330 domain-containing protein [Gammaproteobacteria bacterium]|nr:DUF3330 domain-containing protein [Gammaproteobacteria bacterium]
MNEKKSDYEIEMVECSQCLKEIPASEAKNAEGTDYVVHFCGLECYDKWIKDRPEEKK